MDDVVVALLCLPFIVLPAMVLVAMISDKVKDVWLDKRCFSLFGDSEQARHVQK